MKAELPIISFPDANSLNLWLQEHYASSEGIWLRIFKKASGEKTVDYQQALEELLCFGWIDGQRKSLDDKSFIQRITPRRQRSIWSKRNTLIIEKLIKENRVKDSGLAEVERAKKDGRWENAYSSPKNMNLSPEVLSTIMDNPRAYARYQKLTKAELYTIAFKMQTANTPKLKEKRLALIIHNLEKKYKI